MELIRTEPYEYIYPEDYPNVPELTRPTPPETIWVPWGEFRSGAMNNTFASEGFRTCTGFIFVNASSTHFGLLHALPNAELHLGITRILAEFAKGKVLPIEGSACTPNQRLKLAFRDELGIKVLDPINFEVGLLAPNFSAPFQLVVRPDLREILIARNGFKDLQVYRGP